jgi:hypothetical protein
VKDRKQKSKDFKSSLPQLPVVKCFVFQTLRGEHHSKFSSKLGSATHPTGFFLGRNENLVKRIAQWAENQRSS